MKLVDFTFHSTLNSLRQQMDAPLVDWQVSGWTLINSEELRRRLNSLEGIEVDIDEIATAENGTFEYQGQKVLVYIRDQYSNPKYPNREYKFHIANCDTMERAFTTGRADRYVVSSHTDGRFLINVRDFYTRTVIKENAIEELHVCKNCLLRIHYNGYHSHGAGHTIYAQFALVDFFEKYGGSQITRRPRHTDLSAPPDQYTQDFEQLSQMLKERNGWRCEECGKDLKDHKDFLHTHHKNGTKGDNALDNLRTLCIACHADMPNHGHLRFSPEFSKFKRVFDR